MRRSAYWKTSRRIAEIASRPCGVSSKRFMRESAVIRDEHMEDGGVQDCTMDWEEKIAAETYGWP